MNLNTYRIYQKGEIDLNITQNDSKLPSIWPSGIYKTELNLTEPSSEVLFLKYHTEIKSEIKTSF